MQRAIFLDRDGTLVKPYAYPTRREHLQLFEGVADGLQRLKEIGFRLIVITNQSGVARGLLSLEQAHELNDHLRHLLSDEGVELDAVYLCPHHPQGTVRAFTSACTCRKPEIGLLLEAEQDFDLDMQGSWMVGDEARDVEAGRRAGCRTLLIENDLTRDSAGLGRPDKRAATIAAGLRGLFDEESRSPK